jgi:hypothetical protein
MTDVGGVINYYDDSTSQYDSEGRDRIKRMDQKRMNRRYRHKGREGVGDKQKMENLDQLTQPFPLT